jgi:hypothetical protein
VLVEQGNNHNNNNKDRQEPDIWSLYLFALKSPVTREKYKTRLDKFFNFIGLEGKSIEEKSHSFIERYKTEGSQWVFNSILKFMQFHLERVNRKEITGSTIQNYLKSIKLFCEMADIPVTWNKIRRGLPRGRTYADDRIPTIEEIRKILEYLIGELKPLYILWLLLVSVWVLGIIFIGVI